MWISRKEYDDLLERARDAEIKAAQFKAEADGLDKLLIRAEQEVKDHRFNIGLERARAERAIDELLQLKVGAAPVSQQNQFDPTTLDDMFETEDPEQVKRLQERIATEGVATIYDEHYEELHGNE